MATRTIGSGGDHADINAWVLYLQGIDPFSAIQEGLIVSSGISVTAKQAISGFDEGGFGWVLRANTGASFREHANAATNPLIYDSTKGAFVDLTTTSDAAIEVDVTNGTIKDLQLTKTSGYSSVVDTVDSGKTLTIDSCIIKGVNGVERGVRLRKGSFLRNLLYTSGATGILVSSGNTTLDRNTIVNIGSAGSTFGIEESYGSHTLTNNAVAGFNTDASGSSFSGSNNATDKATGGLPSTARQNSLVAATEWEGATTDFRVKSTSAKLKDNGTGSSVDIIGQSASGTVDIGAWELQAGGGGGSKVPNIVRYLRRKRAA